MSIKFVPFNIPFDPTRPDPIEEAFARAAGTILTSAALAPIERKAVSHEYGHRESMAQQEHENMLDRLKKNYQWAREDTVQRARDDMRTKVELGQMIQVQPGELPDFVKPIHWNGGLYLPYDVATKIGQEYRSPQALVQPIMDLSKLLDITPPPELAEMGFNERMEYFSWLARMRMTQMSAWASASGGNRPQTNEAYPAWRDAWSGTREQANKMQNYVGYVNKDGEPRAINLSREDWEMINLRDMIRGNIAGVDEKGNPVWTPYSMAAQKYGAAPDAMFQDLARRYTKFQSEYGYNPHDIVLAPTGGWETAREAIMSAYNRGTEQQEDWTVAEITQRLGGAGLVFAQYPQLAQVAAGWVGGKPKDNDELVRMVVKGGAAPDLMAAAAAFRRYPNMESYLVDKLMAPSNETIVPDGAMPLLQEMWRMREADLNQIDINEVDPAAFDADEAVRKKRLGGTVSTRVDAMRRDYTAQQKPLPSLYTPIGAKEVGTRLGGPAAAGMEGPVAQRLNQTTRFVVRDLMQIKDPAMRMTRVNEVQRELMDAALPGESNLRTKIRSHLRDVYESLPNRARFGDEATQEQVFDHLMEQTIQMLLEELNQSLKEVEEQLTAQQWPGLPEGERGTVGIM